MYSYTAATLAIRAKCSFSFHYLSLPNDQPFCCHFSGSPRFLSGYLLGLPSPLPSKTLFNAGRWRLRIFYRSRESDMMGLLPEAEERFTGLVEPSWKKGRREIQIESNEGEHRSSRKKGKTGICSSARSDGLSSIHDSEVNEIGRRRAGGEFLVGFCNGKKGARYDEVDVAEEEVREVRKYVDDSRREKRFPSKRDVTLDSRKDESSKRNGNLMRLGVKNVEEKVDQPANLAQQVNFRESVSDRRSKKVTKLSFIRLEDELDDVKRTSVSSNVKKIEKGESSTSAARKTSDIGHLMTGRDQQKRSLEKESKVANFRYNVTQSTAHPQRDFEETSVRGRGEQAFLEQSSAQVSQDKRIQLDRYAVKQDESKRSTQRLNEVSLSHGSDLERTSPIDDKSVMGKHMFPNLVQDSSQLSRNKRSQMELELHLSVVNRSEEKADKLIMEGNSIQLRGGERKKIDMGAVEHDEAQRSTHMFREVSEAHSGSMEASSLSRENWEMEFKSCSVQSSVPATKDKGTQVEMHDAFYDQIEMSMFDTNNIVNAASSLNYPVSRVDPQEYGAPLASNQVSSIIEQNDQASKQAYLLYGARMESERDASEFNLTRSNNRRISNSHETYNSRIENEKNIYSTETSSLVLTREEEIQRSSLTGQSLQSESMEITSTGSLHGISSPQPTNSELKYDAGWIGYQKIQHDMIYSGRTFEKSSASHVGEFVGDIQKEVVALKESGKTPNVSAGFQIGKPGRRDVQATLRIDNQNETSSTVLTQEKEETQSSLLVGESSQYKTMKIASTGSLGDVSSSVKNYSEVDNHNSRDGPDAIRHITNSTIKPVKRLVKTSAFHADEFVDEIQQDIISLNESRKEPNISIRFQIEEVGGRESEGTAGMQVGELTESIGYGDGRQIEEGQRLLSPGSGVSGPSDEMCSVQILSSQETSNAEEPNENSPTSGAVVLTTLETDISRRSPKSLWSYVADIIRLSWILRGHSHSSTSKSHKRTSSNESLSSEAWFSGPEPEEDGAGDEIQNAKNAGLLKESGPVKESVILPLKESNKEDMLTEIEPNSSISSGFMTSGLSDRIASFTVDAEHTQDSRSSQGTLSSVAIVESQLASKFEAALPSVTDIEESRARDKMKVLKPSLSYPAAVMRVGFSSSRIQATGVETADMGEGNNSSLENFEQPLVSTVDSALPRITDIEEVDRPGSIPNLELDPFREKLPEVGESKEAGIKRRKFQRNKQVLSEQFDEWEEAFKRENEQKKLDEFFMREAILEAKKGADTWEVPVGAVLVQNGRIIARGCNMVEELRDSTAHAEMICIREASNFLRTWRLAETTLYVTLEPCPMCAGAILQARIDTVVWGAPNRLLGADGSWVRLFPGGDGGSSSTNPTSQMTGPVHPFHPKITIRRGVLETECGDVMQQFFKLRRKNDKKPESPPPPNLPISTRPTKFFSKLHNIFSLIFCL